MSAQILLCASAMIVLLLGTLHLVYTFTTNKFLPRDAALAQRMREVAPLISRQTSMWRAWIGFNASHSLGMMLFGLIYGYLALTQPALLLADPFLLGLGGVFLASLLVLARRYWFRIPFIGIALALVLHLAGALPA